MHTWSIGGLACWSKGVIKDDVQERTCLGLAQRSNIPVLPHAIYPCVFMPHVVVEGPASLGRLYQQFAPESVRQGACIFKLKAMYLNTTQTEALIDCVVVEDGLPQNFYALLAQKSPSGRSAAITVRLDPLTDPQKTDGVKRLVALLGQRLKVQDPACAYGATNLTDYLDRDA